MTVALDLAGVHKRFGSVRALDGASLELRGGEVHGLLGQNGCGKSTLIKVLTGFHGPDAVERAELWDAPLDFPVTRPQELGFAVIHQDLGLVDAMTVTENVGVSTAYDTRALRGVSWRRERERARELLSRIGARVDPDHMVGTLAAADRAAVAVARALRELQDFDGRQVLVLDEPTAALPAREAEHVIAIMRAVAARGSAVVFISHRLSEVMAVCDRATVMRDGRTVATVDVADSSPRELIAMMLGRDIGRFYPPRLDRPPGEVRLAARDLRGRVLDGVDLDLRSGEILGISGLVGQGQDELPYLLAGSAPQAGGVVELDGVPVAPGDAAARLRGGLVLVPANRKRDGVWLEASAAENISLPVLSEHVRAGMLRPRGERDRASDLLHRLGVRPPEPDRTLSRFSGGNQQKVVLAKWLQRDPRVILLEEPTQGVDAGAKREILELLRAAAQDGAAILLCSTDHEEVAHVATRVLVLRDGRVRAELTGDDVNEQAVLEHANAMTEVHA